MSDALVDVEPRSDADAALEVRVGPQTVARTSLWWSHTAMLDGQRVGYIGEYAAGKPQAAQVLLAGACRRLRAAGCALAVGPIDGSTWQRYRFVTERGDRPRFLLEPDNPDAYPEHLRAAGFAPLARYVSAEEALARDCDPRARRAAARLGASGVTIRPFDPARFDAELDAMYDVAAVAFARNLLFTPLDRAAFHALYAPLREWIDPAFVRIAEDAGRAVGFAFALADRTALDRGACIDTLVGKTQARLPDRRYAGLGTVMLDDVRQCARERGLRRLIHALIRDDSVACNGSERVARVFRTYALFARSLA